jgi:hypothetical protein
MHTNDLTNKDVEKTCKQAIEQLKDIINLVKDTPNDATLGKIIRNYVTKLGNE